MELVAFNLALTLALAELALRAYATWSGASPMIDDSMDAYRLIANHDYGNGLRGNRLGYPGRDFEREKTPGRLRVAALGDSFAVGPAVPYSENFLYLVERHHPEVEVYNFGVSGIGPREYLAILRRDVWRYQPDYVLVCVFVGNDITETMATPRHLDPRQNCTYLLATRAWRIIQDRWHRDATLSAASSQEVRAPGLAEATYREIEARRLAVCRNPPSPSMEKKWQQALLYLEEIAAECAGRKIPCGLVLIPDEFQVNPSVLSAARQDANIPADELDLELPQRRLSSFCNERTIPCLDLLPAFQQAPRTYAPRDTHWNARGNRLAARQIADWLQAEKSVPILAFEQRRPIP